MYKYICMYMYMRVQLANNNGANQRCELWKSAQRNEEAVEAETGKKQKQGELKDMQAGGEQKQQKCDTLKVAHCTASVSVPT